ncbi:MAG: hypothetical protein FVQ80_00245 [Planctomycetes bacterium]|nr:hypothetical protein [Planctomycetota bacterium]
MDDSLTDDIPQVDDGEMLFRKLTVRGWIVKKGDGAIRPSSAVFISRFDPISVDIASKTTPEESIKEAFALVGLIAGLPKSLGCPVVEDPIEGNPAHALIKGKITKSKARQLATASSWIIPPC